MKRKKSYFIYIFLFLLVVSITACARQEEPLPLPAATEDVQGEKNYSSGDFITEVEKSEESQNDDPGKSGSNTPDLTVPYPGSSFKHEVNMDIKGKVERDKGDDWWDVHRSD